MCFMSALLCLYSHESEVFYCYFIDFIFSGIAQCAELCWQLRGQAGKRQVPNARLALQHNIGLGGAVVVALYQLGFPQYQRYSNFILFYIKV